VTAPAVAITPAEEYRRGVWQNENGLIAYGLDDLLKMQFPARRGLLCRGDVPVFRAGHLGEVYASRGCGKTWFLQTLGLIASSEGGVSALGFRAERPCNVLDVDGEMASEEKQERYARLCEVLGVRPSPRLRVIGADWQPDYMPRLDVPEGQSALEPHVEWADLIILDNRSCLFDPEGEKDPAAWQPAQDWLLSLRRRGKGVLLAHHSNRMGGARGHSKPEDAMNLLLKLSRPDGYVQDQGARFLVEFEKARGVHGAAASPFVAALTDDGWVVEGAQEAEGDAIGRKILDYLAVAQKINEQPKTASAAVRGAGVNRQAGLKAFAALVEQGRVVNLDGYRVA
jgi:putative DNA primase/helicase